MSAGDPLTEQFIDGLRVAYGATGRTEDPRTIRVAESGIAGRLSGRLLDLADQVRRLDPAGRHDPEQFWRGKTELAGQLTALAYDAESRLGVMTTW
jgi:hypothetical protein